MDNKVQEEKVGDNKKSSERINVCSINICGLSERSRFMLDKYVDDNQIDVVCVQETGTSDPVKHKLCNMKVSLDTNNAANKGCAVFTRSGIFTTPLPEISKTSDQIDSVWLLIVRNNKRYIIGTVYMKLGYQKGIKELNCMLSKAKACAQKYHAMGPLLIGDLNARHENWGDTMSNQYGKILLDELDPLEFSVLSPSQPTFLAQNGSSVIDLGIVSNNLVGKITLPTTDSLVNLYSGAPLRGHVPVLLSIYTGRKSQQKTVVEVKLNLDSIDWTQWSEEVDDEVLQKCLLTNPEVNLVDLNQKFETILLDVSERLAEKKRSTKHSKPYWSQRLTPLSLKLKDARKRYQERNTDRNLKAYKDARESFDTAREEDCKAFILRKTSNLNAAQASEFWKEFNKVFNNKSDNCVEPLLQDDELVTDNEKIEEILFETFFEGLHLKKAEPSFDRVFFDEVNSLYDRIKADGFKESKEKDDDNTSQERSAKDRLNEDISLFEVEDVLKTSSASGKSFDNKGIHPTMLKNLGPSATSCLQLIFNRCFKEGNWLWNEALVIFLKKDGKMTYNTPGVYRPISISSYIGKLLESILALRLDRFLFSTGHTDPSQEGFVKKRNTVRYLNRLHLSIKGDIDKKLTVLCLFLDMEKAFDSVWKKGLIAKLHKYGVSGQYLRIIDDFLTNRLVNLNFNGFVGLLRKCLEYGLPQGSALSPILFRFFLIDMLADVIDCAMTEAFKFADDGTVKATGRTTAECVTLMNNVCKNLHAWSCKWRMVINCNPNKTEVMCFNTAEGDKSLIPPQFNIGDQVIKIVEETKVLGLTLDSKLNFVAHSNSVYKSLCHRWVTICQLTNRNWGLNQAVLVRLAQTLFLSKMCYAGIVWLRGNQTVKIEKLWYKMLKTATGAVFNISCTRAEVILGIPPLRIVNKVNTIKHYLKMNIFKQKDDMLKGVISKNLLLGRDANVTLRSEMRDVYLFLEWKVKQGSTIYSPGDTSIIVSKDFAAFENLSTKICSYSKGEMTSFTEYQWQRSLDNICQMNGEPCAPSVSCKRLKIPPNTERHVEVKLMSLFYPNNLMNRFVNKKFPSLAPSPLCICQKDTETPFHIIFECELVQENIREDLYSKVDVNLVQCRSEDGCEVLVSLSRDEKFVSGCLEIIQSGVHKLRKEIILPASKKAQAEADLKNASQVLPSVNPALGS